MQRYFGGVTECFTKNVVEIFQNMQSDLYKDKIETDKMLCAEYGIDYEQQFNIH